MLTTLFLQWVSLHCRNAKEMAAWVDNANEKLMCYT